MRKTLWMLIAVSCLAGIPFATAQTGNVMGHDLAGAATSVASSAGVATVPAAMANTNNGMAEANTNAETSQPSRAASASPIQGHISCTYAFSQAYGFCPAGSEDGHQGLALTFK